MKTLCFVEKKSYCSSVGAVSSAFGSASFFRFFLSRLRRNHFVQAHVRSAKVRMVSGSTNHSRMVAILRGALSAGWWPMGSCSSVFADCAGVMCGRSL